MTKYRNKQNYRLRTWQFRDKCHLKGGVRQGCFLSLILNYLIQYIRFHSLYITSHYYAKLKENPCVGTDASTPFKNQNPACSSRTLMQYLLYEPVSLKLVGENARLKLYKEEKDAIQSNEYLAWYTLIFLWKKGCLSTSICWLRKTYVNGPVSDMQHL